MLKDRRPRDAVGSVFILKENSSFRHGYRNFDRYSYILLLS